jgi:hypothetical protein
MRLSVLRTQALDSISEPFNVLLPFNPFARISSTLLLVERMVAPPRDFLPSESARKDGDGRFASLRYAEIKIRRKGTKHRLADDRLKRLVVFEIRVASVHLQICRDCLTFLSKVRHRRNYLTSNYHTWEISFSKISNIQPRCLTLE